MKSIQEAQPRTFQASDLNHQSLVFTEDPQISEEKKKWSSNKWDIFLCVENKICLCLEDDIRQKEH